jgi:hypothetical protein
MDQFKPPSALNLEGNLSENWKRWKQRFELYMKATGTDEKDEEVKIAILLHCIGEDALEIYNTFSFGDTDAEAEAARKVYDTTLQKFDQYCTPRKNTLFERFKFWQRSQREGETVDQFATDLKRMIKNCEYREPPDIMVRDRLVFGLWDAKLQAHLLKEDVDKLTLEKSVAYCRAAEATNIQIKEIRGGTTNVHVVQQKRTAQTSGQTSSQSVGASVQSNASE